MENYCPVWLPGNSFIFTAIYSNPEWLWGPALGRGLLLQNDMWVYQATKEKKKSGTRPNHHFKSHIIHLDGNYNSIEGHCALFCCWATVHMSKIIVCLQHRVERQNGKGIFFFVFFFRKYLRFTLQKSCRAYRNSYFTTEPSELGL